MKNSMFKSSSLLLVFSMTLMMLAACNTNADQKTQENINLGNWTVPKLDKVMEQKSTKTGAQDQIYFLSGQFLGTPYEDHTLTGDLNTPEVFTINLGGMDCFTYIDYVEALRLSGNYPEFKSNVEKIRYKNGEIAFTSRNHFFSDWPVNNPGSVKDVTREIGGDKAIIVTKNLNVKKDGSNYLPGIAPKQREFYYLPSGAIDAEIVGGLNTGDYVGIYTELPGLDVTHTGIVIKKDGRAYLRHASSRSVNEKVVDEDLMQYIENKPGLVVYRPVN